MNSRVINDPSALGWEYDPDTGRWTWGGHSSSGGGGGGSFPEAPVDGEQYARQNAGWSMVEHPEGGSGGGTVTTADVELTNPTTFMPSGMATQEDANSYISEELEKIIPDANADGTIYGRQNNAWVAVPAGGGGGDGNGDLSAYYTKTESDSRYQPKGNYLVSSDLDSYATQTWVGQNYQIKGSYAAGNHNHNGVYQPAGNYLTGETDPTVPPHVKSISTADINKWNNPPAGGGFDGNFNGNRVVFTCENTTTAFQVTAPNCGIFMNSPSAGQTGKFLRLAGDKLEFLKGDYSAVLLSIDDNGVVRTNNNFGGTSFTSTVNNKTLLTMYGNAIANEGNLGAGLYFTNSAQAPSILPCRGTDFAQVNNKISLGDPNWAFSKVYSVAGVGAKKRHTQNDGEAVLSVKDLIDVFESLREATKEEKTMEGLRDSIGNCVGGIVERLEAIQAATDEQTAKELEMYADNEEEPMPPFTLTPELPPVE